MSSPSDNNPKPVADPGDEADTGTTAQRFFRTYWQIARGFSRRLEPLLLANHGLDLKEFAILKAIQRDVRYPTGLAAHLGLSKDTTSRAIRKLLHSEWLERKIDTEDSRRTRLSLTPAGLELLVEMDADLNGTIGTLLAQLEGNQASRLLQDMEALVQLLNSDGGSSNEDSGSNRSPTDDTGTEPGLD
jgi:DNA-binding MarR family transcriptional regulator